MHMILVDQDLDLASLAGRLAATPQARAALLTGLQQLNHLGAQRIAAGTVLLVPDSPGLAPGAASPVDGQGLAAFQAQVAAGFAAALLAARQDQEALAAEAKLVAKALAGRSLRPLLAADPGLKDSAAAAAGVFAADLRLAEDAEVVLRHMQTEAAEQLDALAKLLS